MNPTHSLRPRLSTAVLFGFGAMVLLAGTPARAAGGGGGVAVPSGPALNSEQRAIVRYQEGQKQLEKAAKYQAKMASAKSEKDRKKLEGKARKRFEKAARYFGKSIKENRDLFQAHAQLGFALRSQGRYEEALAAYDRALEIEPRYGEAVEYRAEAYLELGRLEECKFAYMQLFRGAPVLAEQLMAKMKDWAQRQPEAGGQVQPAELQAFGRWIEERSGIAKQAGAAGAGSARRW